MKLAESAIEFRTAAGVAYAKSKLDHRWYKVRGITHSISLLMSKRRDVVATCNMIVMDLYVKILERRGNDSRGALAWLTEYFGKLNLPKHKTDQLTSTFAALLTGVRTPSLSGCKRLWDTHRVSACIGVTVDLECKEVYNGKKVKEQTGPISRLILTQLEGLLLQPMCGGVKVAGIPTPDRVLDERGNYTFHNNCADGCESLASSATAFYTEIDLVAYDTVSNTIALLELKTRHNDVLDKVTLLRYNTQLWLSWLMFSLTYPSMAEQTSAYLVIIRPGTNHVTIRRCARPYLSKRLKRGFPWLSCLCSQVLNALAPTCGNTRASRRAQGDGRFDVTDLCYRNMLFNHHKHGTAYRRDDASNSRQLSS